MFTHLHGHSTFSFLEAIGKVPKILDKAKELGMQSIAIGDYNGLFSAVSFYKDGKDKGIKPIIGVELGFTMDSNAIYDQKNVGNICILAKNKVGYTNLIKIVSFANTTGFKTKQTVDLQTLRENNEGIIIFAGGENSWIGKLILAGEREEKIAEILQIQKEIVGAENIFLEVIAQEYTKIPNLKKINDTILHLSTNTQIECIVDNSFHYINKEDKYAREIALAIKDGYKMYDEQRRKPAGDFHIMSEEEIIQILQDNGFDDETITKMIETNNRIGESVETKIDLGQSLFPNYESPESIIDIYEKNKETLIINKE